MPSYLRNSLPDPKAMPAKRLVADFPETMSRPPAETLDKMVGQLYQQELAKS